MPFFQNLFNSSFEGFLLLNDHQYNPTYRVHNNNGRSVNEVVSYGKGPFDLSGDDAEENPKSHLVIKYCLYNSNNWSTLSVDITQSSGSASAVTLHEIVNALNSNTNFTSWFTAKANNADSISISQKKPVEFFKFYVDNVQAETVLKFNALAGISELPTYFARHTIGNTLNFPDSAGLLIQLDMENNDHKELVTNAVDLKGKKIGLNPNVVKEDWELLKGSTSLFQFTKGPSSGPVETTNETIIYNTGATVGGIAKKIIERLDSGGVLVAKLEIPHVLIADDLITP